MRHLPESWLLLNNRIPMQKPFLTVVGVAAVFVSVVGASISMGFPSFAADEPHSELVTSLITYARERSISREVKGVDVPADLGSPERVRRGAGNYEAMCVDCHLSPSAGNSEIRQGLYPTPPNLSVVRENAHDPSSDARDFWIIKHGIKASGMPAWAKGGMDDAAIWDLVAFLNVLPTQSTDSYQQLVSASNGHSHSGIPDAHGASSGPSHHSVNEHSPGHVHNH